jgi:DNA-binding LytR/AlgR family response regulator
MKCISVDDNPIALAALRQLIEQVNGLQLIGEFSDAMEAYTFLKKETADLIFLDVEMPGINGLELIDSLDKPPLIIMVTAKKEYAIEAFEKHVVDYLVKPVALPRFISSVNFAQKILETRQTKREAAKTLFVKTGGRWNKLNIRDIKYLKAMGDYIRIFTTSDNYMVNKPMKVILDSLPEDKFVRVHRSYAVNIDHIDNIEESTIVIGKDVIPISEGHKTAFMQHLNLL